MRQVDNIAEGHVVSLAQQCLNTRSQYEPLFKDAQNVLVEKYAESRQRHFGLEATDIRVEGYVNMGCV